MSAISKSIHGKSNQLIYGFRVDALGVHDRIEFDYPLRQVEVIGVEGPRDRTSGVFQQSSESNGGRHHGDHECQGPLSSARGRSVVLPAGGLLVCLVG